jgi:putative addiction module killer protein
VSVVLIRISNGNLSNTKAVGAGVAEYKLDWGPGYRIYFGREGDRLIILLGGGTKQRQSRDIAEATSRWLNYKKRRKDA